MKLARASLLNLLGLGLPMVAALVWIPGLLAALGPSRFGVLALIWTVANYFGLFDLGLSRVLTQRLARAAEDGRHTEAGQQAATTLTALVLLGLASGLVLALCAPALAGWMADAAVQDEATLALRWLALGAPLLLVTAGLRAVLEAAQAFTALNLIRAPIGVWMFAGPALAVLLWGPSLAGITAVIVLGRGLGCAALALAAWRAAPAWRRSLQPRVVALRAMLADAGWLSVGSVVSPLTASADRFLIAALLSSAAVSDYVVPQELVTKLSILPAAIASALMPSFARAPAQANLRPGLWAALLALVPTCALLAAAAEPILSTWLGRAYAPASVAVLQVMCLGTLLNGLAYVPLTWLHASGEFRTPTLVQLGVLLGFVPVVWALTASGGILGAAWAWTLRLAADALLLGLLCQRRRRATA